MDATSTEGPIPGAAETVGVPEARDSREKVLEVFNDAYGAFENYPADKLTPEQQSARDLIKSVKERTLDRDKVSYRNRFTGEDGKEYSQQEYMPVDELIIWLRERVKSGELSPEDEVKYREQERVLHGNAQEYYRGRNKKENSRKMARIRQEAGRIAADPRLATENEHDNWLKANDILLQRRELIIPRKKDIVEPPTTPPTDPPPPTNPPPEEIKREVAFVNRTLDVRKRAGEVAEELLRNEMRRGSILNPLNWGRKIGLRIMEEYWRQKLTQQVYTSMLANNNSYLNLDMARSQIGFADVFRRQAGNLTMQTQADIGQEREAGFSAAEKVKLTGNERAGQRVVEAQGALKDMILSQIIRPTVEGGNIDYAEIQQRLRVFVEQNQNDPQIQAVFGRDSTQYGRLAEYFASDILETAEVIRQDIAAHKYAIEQLDKVVTVKLANTSWAAETQAQFNRVDKAVAWAERHRISGLIGNPAFIGAAFSIGMYGSMRLLGIGGRAAQIAVPGAGLLPGALLAAARRNYDLKVDMASHQAERAYNMQIGQGSPRREALEKFAYNTASVDDLINGGGVELVGGQNRESIDYLLRQDLLQEPNRQALVRRITEINKRLDFSAVNKVDLITFAGRGQVEQGRLTLVRAVAQARVAVRSAGVTEDVIRADETRFAGEWEGRFTQNKEQQDSSFKWYRVRNAAGAALFGGVAGFAGGFVSHEVLAGIGGFFEAPKPPVAPPSAPDINTIKSMFPGINAVVDPNGHIAVTGAIPQDAQAEMQRLGFTVNQGPEIPGVSHTDIEHRPVFGPDGVWTEHKTNVNHREWYAYDRPGSQANELRQFNFKDGKSVILDLSKMEQGFQKGLNPNPINVQEVWKNGEAGFYITTPDTPQDGIWIPDSADGVIDGKVRLDPDDVAHMIKTPNGQISNGELANLLINQDELKNYEDGSLATELNKRFKVFNIGEGQRFGFIEAGRMQARTEGNVLQVFATIRGLGPAPETIGVPITVTGEPTPTFDITPPPVPEVVPTPEVFDTPIIPIPFAPRHPLEPLRKPDEPDRQFQGDPTSDRQRREEAETLQELIQIRPEDLAEITPEQLQKTEAWARNWTSGFVMLEGQTPEERKRILETWTARAQIDRRLLADRYYGSLPPLAPTGQEGVDWKRQTNPGMLTCQLASAGNALRSLGVYNDSLHSEQAILNTLGGQDYADSHPHGASTYDLEDQVLATTQGIRFRGSNSVYEILEAIEKGAAAIIPLDPTHVGTILPGQRINRSATGELQVQVVDPLSGVRLIPVENLIRSNIILAWRPRDSIGIIIEKTTPPPSTGTETTEATISEARDNEYAARFWARAAKGLREAMATSIYKGVIIGQFGVLANMDGYDDNDKERMSAYRQLARQLGFEVGQFRLNRNTGTTIASIKALTPEAQAIAEQEANRQKIEGRLNQLEGEINNTPQGAERRALEVEQESLDAKLSVFPPRPSIPPPAPTVRVNQPPRVETAPPPRNLVERVNKELREAPSVLGATSIPISTQELTEYIKSLPLPAGATVKEINPQIVNGRLSTSGKISTPAGDATFEAVFSNDPTGNLQLVTHKINLPWKARVIPGIDQRIERQLATLNSSIATRVNSQIDPAWETTGFKIEGDRISLNARRKSAVNLSEQPTTRLTAPQADLADVVRPAP